MSVQVRVGQTDLGRGLGSKIPLVLPALPYTWCSAFSGLSIPGNAAAVQPHPLLALPGIQLFLGICLHGLEATDFLPCLII